MENIERLQKCLLKREQTRKKRQEIATKNLQELERKRILNEKNRLERINSSLNSDS